ncbi:MAG TPA: cytochrome c biogenesis protein CcdA [Gemmatimonadaceae bacterium]|nr:cytochrome c biogenesis protein CcdA [Gemmatimonadaceae bacterium]
MLLPSDISTLLSSNPALALPAVFAGGVLTSLTPCIYPMIPITVSIVGGQTIGAGASVGEGAGATQSKRRTVALTLSYVVGLALVYALLGLIAGLTGTLFGSISTNPWLYFAMANLLIVFALAMLDVLPVRVPQTVLRRASEAGSKGGIAGSFAMGAASGLVAAPCGAPVMAAVLTWVSLTKSAFLGFVYLFVFSLGMTSLLVAVGLSAGLLTRLPRAGVWMIWIKRVFALLMLAVAEYYLIKMGQILI